ncbi:hypothetical protein DMUE_3137 [Dictyocoela muelleri]|nr:hypothetical protein DMUE_3137 [Dictyocoela muelleri]
MAFEKISLAKIFFYTVVTIIILLGLYKTISLILSFYFIPASTYATNFYGYMTTLGHKQMISKTYRFYKWNSYDPNEDNNKVHEWIKKAQTGSGYYSHIVFDGFPEHYPRNTKYYYTHNFYFNNNIFLMLRKDMIRNERNLRDLKSTTLSDKEITGEKVFEAKPKFFWICNSKKVFEVYMQDKNFRKLLTNVWFFLFNLNSNLYDQYEKIDDEFITKDSILQVIIKIIWIFNNDGSKISEQEIYNALVGLGKVNSTPIARFIYSRLLYLTYFVSLYDEDENKTIIHKTKDDKCEIAKAEFLNYGAGLSYLISKIYKFEVGYTEKGFWGSIRRIFSMKNVEVDRKAKKYARKIIDKYNSVIKIPRITQAN